MKTDPLTFWDHLDVLRSSLIRMGVAVVVFAVAAFCMKETLFSVVLAPRSSDFVTYRLLGPTFGQDIVLLQLTAMTQAQLATSLGHPYIDFEAPILDKKYGFDGKASLSQYVGKNKVVLLDFWASWCTPCINELPNLKAAYKKFKSKGFEIVSVSVDDGTDEWIKAVKDNGMNWIQLWNGEEMQNSAAVKYSITAIPSTFLIDADGTIIARNLRDKELEEALEDYFSNK